MIQIEREKLEKVLDALKANDILVNGTETSGGLVFCLDGYYSDCFDVDPVNKQTEEAITIIKDVLAQPDQFRDATKMMAQKDSEPVAWLSIDSIGERYLCFDKPLDNDPVQPLYTKEQL